MIRASKSSTINVPRQQLLHSKGLRSATSEEFEELIRNKSPSPKLNDLPCCVHCHRNPFDLNDLPLTAPSILHAETNYKDASTQMSVDEQKESSLTVLPAQTPAKRTREESAGEFEEEPASKRHQSNPTQNSTHISSSTRTSVQSSTQASTQPSPQNSTQTASSTVARDQTPSTSAPTTPKRTTMASITQAKSRAKAPRSSPVTRSKVDSLQITSNMTWGQMTRVHSRRAKLAASRAKQIQSPQDEELLDEQSPQSSQSAADQAPTTPQTAPQPIRTGLFGSIRKAFDFVPQLPVSVTKSIFGNPFSPIRSAPAVESQQTHPPSPQPPANYMDDDTFMNIPEEELKEVQPPPQRIRDALSLSSRRSSSVSNARAARATDEAARTNAEAASVDADAGHADVETEVSSQKRKRTGFGLYFENPEYNNEDSSGSDSSDEESSAPTAKKQKLDEMSTPRSVLKKRNGNGASTVLRPNKRVTFDDSPVDTPSKIRTRSFEYTGTTFADAPSQSYASPSSDDETNLSNSPGTKANTEANTPFYYEPPKYPSLPENYVVPADFTPTSANPRPGTFCLDFNTYDENDDEIDWDAPVEAIHSNIVVGDPDTPTSVQAGTSSIDDPATTPAMELPPATPRIAHAELPAVIIAPAGMTIHVDVDAGPFSTKTTADTKVLADVTQKQINKVRSTAEQHKSKNPSRLSQVEHAASVSPPAEDEYNEFDAGWPKPKSYVEAGVCSQRILDIVRKGWDPRDSIIGEVVYQQDLKEWTDAHRLEKEQGVPVTVNWGDEEDEEL
jgi:hypothetical protein